MQGAINSVLKLIYLCTQVGVEYLINLIKMFRANQPCYTFEVHEVDGRTWEERGVLWNRLYGIDYGARLSNCGQLCLLLYYCAIYFINWYV